MFNDVFKFELMRTTKQAWGFYFAHLLFALILAFILGFVLGLFSNPGDFVEGFNQGTKIGAVIALIYVTFVSFAIVKQKNLLGNFKYILLALAAMVLALLGGAILGLIIPAVLTKKPIFTAAAQSDQISPQPPQTPANSAS